MTSSNDQPPLTRRQVRELERAREAGEAITGSISVVSGSPVPSNMPVTTPSPAGPSSASTPTRVGRPGSHVAAPSDAPASAPYADGHAPTRRELRAQRDSTIAPTPAPLIAPQPESDRNLSDALSHVADIEKGAAPAPASASAPRSAPASARAEAVRPTPPSRPDASPVSPASPPHADVPGPRAFRRDESADAPVASSGGHGPQADAASAPGRRRSTASSRPNSAGTPLGETPPPSSTPTVFPFALSGTEPTSTLEPAAPAAAAASAAPAGAAAPAAAPAAPAPAARAAAAPTTSAAAESPRGTAPAAAAPGAQAKAAPSIPASVPAPDPAPYVPPTGHWSTQADIPDDDTVETVGSHFGTMTGQQNALILNDDSLPDVTGALNATGEVIITGSIDLPRSLAATGSHNVQRIDGADIDRMLEEGDREAPDNDATPVRASRAVSANTSTRAVVLTSGKPRTNRLPIVAGICGLVVIVVIVGLVVWGLTSGVLSH